MRGKRRIQIAILLREDDYCCDRAQFAASSPARDDSSQGRWAMINPFASRQSLDSRVRCFSSIICTVFS
jgi:hypothetical protein